MHSTRNDSFFGKSKFTDEGKNKDRNIEVEDNRMPEADVAFLPVTENQRRFPDGEHLSSGFRRNSFLFTYMLLSEETYAGKFLPMLFVET